jgi:hypothetical protein
VTACETSHPVSFPVFRRKDAVPRESRRPPRAGNPRENGP